VKKNSVIVYGRACRGLGVSQGFTEITWVRDQLISKLKITPYPGTFNVEIEDPKYLKQIKKIRKGKGIEIVPGDPSFCSATCFPVVVEGKIDGVVVIPNVDEYPISKVEVISSCNIKETLSIDDGALVKLEVIPNPQEFV
jgi:CTP-dependent riboflavin kinase